jgi:type IV pilus assembly protein PilE
MMPLQRGRARSAPRFASHGGWSVIELLVVVAVLTILTSSAVPAFRTAILRAQRTEATAALLALAAAQERFHLQHQTYAADVSAAPPDGLGLPAVTAGGRYVITITAADAATFAATAAAQGRQARDAHCAEFGIDATGSRTATNDDCWTR